MSEVTREQIEKKLAHAKRLLESAEADCQSTNAEIKTGGAMFAKAAREDIYVLTLVLERLDMEPRDIADAPKDGTTIWAFWGDEWVKTYWAKRDKFEGWRMPQGMVIKAYAPETWKPTHFLPLSSLPTPKDVT